MTRHEIAKAITEKTGMKMRDSMKAVDCVFDTIKESLRRHEPVLIKNFGVFKFRHMKKRTTSNPFTGAPMTIPEHDRVVFNPSIDIKETIN